MRITDLGGHSGCKILLCEGENKTFVRKISSSDSYNKRLAEQADKQRAFRSHGGVLTAPVLSDGYTEDGLYFFDMQYVQGITLAEYIKTIEIGKIRSFVESLVESVVDTHSTEEADQQIFLDKIEKERELLQDKHNPVIDKALDILQNHSWENFRRSQCHGDLTLENIIIKDHQLYLIDFLDSFYDCWIMDISTLMQDVQTLWSYRKEKADINTVIRLMIFRDILMDQVKAKVGDKYIEVYYALLLKLIRIYPYTKDQLTYEFLNQKTQSVIDIIEKEEGCVL